jgi:hypothetical protein
MSGIEESYTDTLDQYLISNSQISGGNLGAFLMEHNTVVGSRRSSVAGSSPPENRSSFIDTYEAYLSLGERIGVVEIGIEDIDSISKKVYNLDDLDDKICVICQIELSKKKDLRKLECNHIFCDKCIIKWLKKHNKCPVCNFNLKKN